MHCLVLAAGAASRMGGGKLLLPWRGGTVGGVVLAAAREAGFPVVLVTGCGAAAVEAGLLGPPGREAVVGVVVVRNPDWERGMLGSIQAGLRFLAPHPEGGRASGCLVMPADLPAVPAAVYRLVAGAGLGEAAPGGAGRAVVPWCRGRRGHPVFLPAAHWPAVLDLPPEGRLRDFLDSAGTLALELDEPAIAWDIDTPGDWERLGGETPGKPGQG
jgi:molybdenum cofactor cytidylyltransferase